MEPSIKDRYVILGFVGFAILLTSSTATLIVAEKFNQDNFVRLIVFVYGSLLGWLLYFSFQTVIFDTYGVYKIKLGKKKALTETVREREELPQNTLEPTATLKPISTNGGTPAGTEPPIRPSITPELHKKNRADYGDREQQEKKERIHIVTEYIRLYMSRVADEKTVNHICKEMNSWVNLHTYRPKPITRQLTREITNIPLRHFVWNIPERLIYKKHYNGDNRARFIRALFPHEFADTDIAAIKNFKVEPLKTLIPIDEPENGNLDFYYPVDYVREKQTQACFREIAIITTDI